MRAGKSSTSVVGVNGVGFTSAPWNSDTVTVKNARVGKVCLSFFVLPAAVHRVHGATGCWTLLLLRMSVNPKFLKQFQRVSNARQCWLLLPKFLYLLLPRKLRPHN